MTPSIFWSVRILRASRSSVRFPTISYRCDLNSIPGRPSIIQQRRRPGEAQYYSSQPDKSTPLEPSTDKVSSALQTASETDANNLYAPVVVPLDPNGILDSSHPAAALLSNSSIIIQRQLEMMNVLLGFEQANRYVMMDSEGNHIGYLAERDHGFGSAIARQMFRTHRSFTTHVFDKEQREVLRFHRPFSWISSRIKVYDTVDASDATHSTSTALRSTNPEIITEHPSAQISPLGVDQMRVIGETQQYWAPLRRKYNLFLHRDLSHGSAGPKTPRLTAGDLPLSNSTALEKAEPGNPSPGFAQFAYISEPFLSWDFSLMSADDKLIGSVNRNFVGFAREIFTDTGVYALRMDAASLATEPRHLISQSGAQAGEEIASEKSHSLGMTLDQRAVMLATAVSIDFDYFSRHSGAGGGMGLWPLWMPWGGAAAEEAAATGAAGAASATAVEGGEVGAATRAAQETARGVGAGEGAAAGAGSLAGYEAMQGARGRRPDDASPQAADPDNMPDDPAPVDQQGEDFWGGWPPQSGNSGKDEGSDSGGSDSGGGEGGGGSFFDDWL